MWARPNAVATTIVRAIDVSRTEVYVPGFWWAIMMFIKVIPSRIFRKLKL
jgi:decaprenylphospho-beta-D-erythro-pentofuranosid-2-ulose 2-reductase